MRVVPGLGKADRKFMRLVYRSLGSDSEAVLLGPGEGRDNAVIDIGGSKALILATDPMFYLKKLGPKLSAWLSVHLVASDFTTSGARPRFAALSYDFPDEMGQRERSSYVEGVGDASGELGVAIVGGHTGAYGGSKPSVIGSGTLFGTARLGSYVDPTMAREGDVVLMTKWAAIEAASYLAALFPRHVSQKAGRGVAEEAAGAIKRCSTVTDALAAASAGLGRSGVSSMHDATEGGVLGGLSEISAASGKGVTVDPGRIPVRRDARMVCAAFGLDPLTAPSEGALLLTCGREAAQRVARAVRAAGSPVRRLGVVGGRAGLRSPDGSRLGSREDKAGQYWEAFARAQAQGLD